MFFSISFNTFNSLSLKFLIIFFFLTYSLVRGENIVTSEIFKMSVASLLFYEIVTIQIANFFVSNVEESVKIYKSVTCTAVISNVNHNLLSTDRLP